jgi:benzylsuccinate CoA-transferase BbsF subunit
MSGKGILNGIRILDFSWVLAGPYSTRILADFGAEVIKVQPLLPEAEDKFSRGYANTWNRNKLGISLNMGQPQGIEIARKLIKISDAVVENFSPRVMSNWGLEYPELKKIKPDIILLSMSVMGHSGPWRDYTGFGPTVQSFSGLIGLTSYTDQTPQGAGFSFADHVAGLYASLALMGALEYRRRTGEGQYIDLSQTETMTSLMGDAILANNRERQGVKAAENVPDQKRLQGIYPCLGEDQWCAITISTDKEWEGLKKAMGYPAWTNQESFALKSNRAEQKAALDSLIQEWTRKYTKENLMLMLQKEGVPAGAVQDAADLANDPQLEYRDFWIETEHPEMGSTISDASPIRLEENSPEYYKPAPLKGQDNDYVYRKLLGLSQEEMAELQQDNII